MLSMAALLLIEAIDDDPPSPPPASTRDRPFQREWRDRGTYIRPMIADGTFRRRFRMEYEDFTALVGLVRAALDERDDEMGALRNGAIPPVEYQVAMTLRWLAGGSIDEVASMEGNVNARTTAHAIMYRVIDALNGCRELDCVFPEGDDAEEQARLFRQRSANDTIQHSVGAVGGIFIRLVEPTEEQSDRGRGTNKFYSEYKNGFGMKFQVRLRLVFPVGSGYEAKNLQPNN